MFRTHLFNLIREESEKLNLNFYSGFPYRMIRNRIQFPALWLEPPTLIETEGRNEGIQTYRICLYLMTEEQKYSEPEKEKQWDLLETQALTLIRNLRTKEDVFHIEKFSCSPSEAALTNQNEIALKTEFQILLAFPYEPNQSPGTDINE